MRRTPTLPLMAAIAVVLLAILIGGMMYSAPSRALAQQATPTGTPSEFPGD